MKVQLYPKAQLEALWREDKKLFSPETYPPPNCLRCGNPLFPQLIRNPLSRHADIHICNACGNDEAMRDFARDPLPLAKWNATKEDLFNVITNPNTASLVTECTFQHIYRDTKSIPLSSSKHPVSEIVYSRSDYDGRRWWTTWFDCQKEKPEWELTQEIDGFFNGFFDMPEMRNLDTMRRFSSLAQPTCCNTEFNLYSVTEYFYIWIRLITRSKDYNVYIHYYLKNE